MPSASCTTPTATAGYHPAIPWRLGIRARYGSKWVILIPTETTIIDYWGYNNGVGHMTLGSNACFINLLIRTSVKQVFS